MRRHEDLERKVAKILRDASDWIAWNSAVETAFTMNGGEAERRLQPLYCIDTSEIVEFLLPSSLRENKYPTTLDLSLWLIFAHGSGPDKKKLWVLPPHRREFLNLLELWAERLRSAVQLLPNPDESTLGILEMSTADQFVELAAREREVFSPLLWSNSTSSRSLEEVPDRIQVPDLAQLGLKGWRYEPEESRLKEWEHLLSQARQRDSSSHPRDSSSDIIDAHALHMVELINEALPPERAACLVLSSHMEKVWRVEERHPQQFARLKRNGVPLVQRPQVRLVHELLEELGGQGGVAPEIELIMQRERSRKVPGLCERLHSEFPTGRDRREGKGQDVAKVEELISMLEAELVELNSVALTSQLLHLLNLEIDSPVAANPLNQIRQVLEGSNKDELREALTKKRTELLDRASNLQLKLSVSLVPTPPTALSFSSFGDEQQPWERKILHGTPGGEVYEVHFKSAAVKSHLESIQTLLRELDAVPAENKEEKRRLGVALQREMRRCEVELRTEPELYLLLASAYGSRQQWIQSVDSTVLGLQTLWPKGEPVVEPIPAQHVAWATTELLLFKALAFKSWTLASYKDRKAVAADFLGRAARWIRRCLELQERWNEILGPQGIPDPRCLRELGTIYATAWESEIPLKVDPEDSRHAGIPDAEPTNLDLFLAFSGKAYDLGKEEPSMGVFYENSLLYALTKKDNPADLGKRRELAARLSKREEAKESANFLDTLAWHHFLLADREDRQQNLDRAEAWINQARSRVNTTNKYYKDLIAGHYKEIMAAKVRAEVAN